VDDILKQLWSLTEVTTFSFRDVLPRIVIPTLSLSKGRNLLLKREWRFYIYILASKSRRTYVGMTNSLLRRVMEHKSGELEGFTKRYKIDRLVYYEVFKYANN